MRTVVKFVGATALLGAGALALVVATVPGARAKAEQMRDAFRADFSRREAELTAALSPSDQEVAAARDTWAARSSS